MIPGFDPTKTFKLTIDHTKVDEELADFPLLINLSDSSGTTSTTCSGIFEELTITSPELDTNIGLLIHGAGIDGGDIVDSSTYENTVTVTNFAVQLSDDQSKFGTTSVYFPGNQHGFTIPYSSFWDFGDENFTVDAWLYLTASKEFSLLLLQTWSTGLHITASTSNIYVIVDGTAVSFAHTSYINLNEWFHVAAVRDGNELRVYINGILRYNHETILTNKSITTSTDPEVGTYSNYSGGFTTGYMQEFRVLKGTAAYTADFTPPTAPYNGLVDVVYPNNTKIAIEYKGFEEHEVVDTDVEYLISSNVSKSIFEFEDVATSSGVALTPTGSPFHSNVQGMVGNTSMYFDNTDDQLSMPHRDNINFESTDTFTIDFWYKPNDIPSFTHIINKYMSSHRGWSVSGDSTSGGILLIMRDTVSTNDLLAYSSTSLQEDVWAHIAVVYTGNKDASGVFIYHNGILQPMGYFRNGLTGTVTTTEPLRLGNRSDDTGQANGYLEEVRMSNIARWLAEFDVPTVAYTPDNYDSLLIHSDTTNGSTTFTDSSNYTHSITVHGNTNHSTTKNKFGSSAIYFDGSSDGLEIATHASLTLGTGDFTIDCWINTATVDTQGAANRRIFSFTSANAYNKLQLIIIVSAQANAPVGGVGFYTDAYDILGKVVVCDNTWHHVAMVRKDSMSYLYCDGACQGAFVDTNDYITDYVYVGGRSTSAGSLEGYIDEFRIAKGVARWTTDFTPPGRHTSDANTVFLLQSDSAENYVLTEDISGTTLTIDGNNVAHTTDESVYGLSSLYFDGSSCINLPHNDIFNWGTDDFTIDWWEYRITNPGTGRSVFWAGGNEGATAGMLLGYEYTDRAGTVYMSSNSSSWDIALDLHIRADRDTNKWVHQAVVRYGTAFTFYSDGVRQDGVTSSASIAYGGLGANLGAYDSASSGLHGYIQYFRITKRARWTSNFTPDTSPVSINKTSSPAANQQCYVEIERWDYVNRDAQLWVKVPKIGSGKDTTLLLYYDSTASDNTTYVGETNSTPAENVWDSNYFAVYHMSQEPTGTGCVLDSTANQRHGDTTSMDITNLVDGPVGKAYEYDGVASWNSFGFTAVPITGNTVQIVAKTDGTNHQILDNERSGADYPTYKISFGVDPILYLYASSAGESHTLGGTTPINSFHYISVIWQGNAVKITSNNGESIYDSYTTKAIGTNARNYYSGKTDNGPYWLGVTASIHISSVRRSDGWVNTSYYNQFDNLVNFQHESYVYEGFVQEVGVNVARKVMLFERATGILVDSAWSDPVTGVFQLTVPYSELYFLIVMPDDAGDYNLLAYDKLDPTV